MSSSGRFRIAVCRGPECAGKRAGDAVHAQLAHIIEERDLHDAVILERHICFGRCRVGPNVHVRELTSTSSEPQRVFVAMPPRRRGRSALYNHVREEDACDIIESHVLGGEIVHRLIHRPVVTDAGDRDVATQTGKKPDASD